MGWNWIWEASTSVSADVKILHMYLPIEVWIQLAHCSLPLSSHSSPYFKLHMPVPAYLQLERMSETCCFCYCCCQFSSESVRWPGTCCLAVYNAAHQESSRNMHPQRLQKALCTLQSHTQTRLPKLNGSNSKSICMALLDKCTELLEANSYSVNIRFQIKNIN